MERNQKMKLPILETKIILVHLLWEDFLSFLSSHFFLRWYVVESLASSSLSLSWEETLCPKQMSWDKEDSKTKKLRWVQKEKNREIRVRVERWQELAVQNVHQTHKRRSSKDKKIFCHSFWEDRVWWPQPISSSPFPREDSRKESMCFTMIKCSERKALRRKQEIKELVSSSSSCLMTRDSEKYSSVATIVREIPVRDARCSSLSSSSFCVSSSVFVCFTSFS